MLKLLLKRENEKKEKINNLKKINSVKKSFIKKINLRNYADSDSESDDDNKPSEKEEK